MDVPEGKRVIQPGSGIIWALPPIPSLTSSAHGAPLPVPWDADLADWRRARPGIWALAYSTAAGPSVVRAESGPDVDRSLCTADARFTLWDLGSIPDRRRCSLGIPPPVVVRDDRPFRNPYSRANPCLSVFRPVQGVGTELRTARPRSVPPWFVLPPAERFELGTEVRLLLHCG